MALLNLIFVYWGLLGKWVKYNQLIYFIHRFFTGLAYRSDPATDIYTFSKSTM